MATIELRNLISRNENVWNAQNYPLSVIKSTIPIWCMVYLYEISYYGMVSLDTQHRNVMANTFSNRDIKITEKIPKVII